MALGRFFRSFARRSRGDIGDRVKSRRARPGLDRLESREMLVITSVAGNVHPLMLKPNQGQVVQVRVKGLVANNLEERPTADFRIIDQYRRINTTGPVPLTQVFVNEKRDTFIYSYDVTIPLQAKARSGTGPGRTYYILISAGDRENGGGKYLAVLVPTKPIHYRKPAKTSPTAQV